MKEEYVREGLEFIKHQERKPNNITQSQYNGMIKLQKRIKNKEIVITNTDKTKKSVVMPLDLYMEC